MVIYAYYYTGLSSKLTQHWHGPFRIIEKLSDVSYKLQTFDDKRSVQTVHVNRLKRVVDPEGRTEHADDNDNNIEETVENGDIIEKLDMMRSRNESKRLEKHYLVRYESGETQWVKESEISNYKLINEFHKGVKKS